jgi:hypothetical protein
MELRTVRAWLSLALAATLMSANAIAQTHESLLPESGSLSPTAYTNHYYEFQFQFPAASDNTPLRTRLQPRGAHALLAMVFQNQQVTTEVSIRSFDATFGRVLDPAAAAQEVVDEVAHKREALGLEPLPIRVEKSGEFYYVEQYKYAEKRLRIDLFFSRRDHLLHLSTSTGAPDQEKFKRWLLHAIRDYTSNSADDATYFGPTVPDAVVEETIATKPGVKLSADATLTVSSYQNKTLELRFRIPAGWKAADPQSPGEARRFQVKASEAELATREHQFLSACSKPLLRLTGPPNQSMLLIAIDPKCLQLSFPDVKDARAAAEFEHLLLAYPDFGGVRGTGFTQIAGQPFFKVRSLLPDQADTDGMRRRLTQVAYVTARNGQMLLWFFVGRSESELPPFDSTALEFTSGK